jgi:ABC-type glycerol-3-phosphate transport system substrate-binding protein
VAGDILGGGIGVVVSRDAPDAAVDFVRYLTSVNVQRQLVNLGFVPVTAGAAEGSWINTR